MERCLEGGQGEDWYEKLDCTEESDGFLVRKKCQEDTAEDSE